MRIIVRFLNFLTGYRVMLLADWLLSLPFLPQLHGSSGCPAASNHLPPSTVSTPWQVDKRPPPQGSPKSSSPPPPQRMPQPPNSEAASPPTCVPDPLKNMSVLSKAPPFQGPSSLPSHTPLPFPSPTPYYPSLNPSPPQKWGTEGGRAGNPRGKKVNWTFTRNPILPQMLKHTQTCLFNLVVHNAVWALCVKLNNGRW